MPLDFPTSSLRKNAFRRIRHIPGQPLTYLQNPKAACTSIELALWRAHSGGAAPRNPHREKNRPYIRNIRTATPEGLESLFRSEFFSVVRNPYARFLSAYLDKVGAPKRSWERISKTFGLTAESNPTISELLDTLQTCDPTAIDHHFRPQYVNLYHGIAPLNFIGHLEKMEAVQHYLTKYGFSLSRDAEHATNAANRIQILSDRDIHQIRNYYARDFEIYGYSDDPNQQDPVREPIALFSDRTLLRDLLERHAHPRLMVRRNTKYGRRLFG